MPKSAIGIYYGNTGNIQINGSTVVSASSWPHNTTMALALDLDNGKAYFGRHNVWQNSAEILQVVRGQMVEYPYRQLVQVLGFLQLMLLILMVVVWDIKSWWLYSINTMIKCSIR